MPKSAKSPRGRSPARAKSPARSKSPGPRAAQIRSGAERDREKVVPRSKWVPEKFTEYVFGGPIGGAAIMMFSHFIVYYMWISGDYYKGKLIYPASMEEAGPWINTMLGHMRDGAVPTMHDISIYAGFLAFEWVLAVYLPGPYVEGLPVPSQGNRKLKYLINGFPAWWCTVLTAITLDYWGLFRLASLVERRGQLLTAAVIAGDLLAIGCFVGAKVQNLENRASGNAVYDFFLGTYLNPRVGSLDIKMWAEIRVSWCLLFLLTLGSAYKQYETQGQVSNSIIFLAVAHWLYANACHKGEECIPTTWDIFHENFGWYLAFWNLAGVPFTYSFQAQFLIHNDPINYSLPVICLFFAALLGAYWVWDTANSQKNRFRMHLRGAKWQEWTFPQLPWGTLKDPHFITTHNGGTILADGWYRFGRKIHYTADIVMAFLWGAICGFDAFLPFFYCLFFTTFITHRYFRDVDRMKAKYGKYWDEYTKECPYVFIPYVW